MPPTCHRTWGEERPSRFICRDKGTGFKFPSYSPPPTPLPRGRFNHGSLMWRPTPSPFTAQRDPISALPRKTLRCLLPDLRSSSRSQACIQGPRPLLLRLVCPHAVPSHSTVLSAHSWLGPLGLFSYFLERSSSLLPHSDQPVCRIPSPP